MADRVGQQLGNYRLIRMVGRGGFADVYLGEHVYLNTQAAIKVLHAQLASDTMGKFLSEAKIVAGLAHPHIVRVLDFGMDNYTPFLVMEYAPNGTLRQRHPRGMQLPLPLIVSYVKQIAAALQYAHDQRLIHRDIKPENMLVGRNNDILLSDFGIATISQTSRSLPTQDISGTVAYMAPEQIQGRARPASDQYSLAIITYEWLTGICPFHGSFFEVATQHMLAPPPPLRDKVPNVSRDVEQVLLMALAKEPEKRFMRVEAFTTALEQASQFQRAALSDASPNATFFIPPSNPATMTVLPPDVAPSTSEATQVATPASPAPFHGGSQTIPASSFSTPPSALPNLPGVTPPYERQAQQRRGISRRGVLVGLVGLAAVVGGGATYLVLSRELFGPTKAQGSSSTPTPTTAPTHTPTSQATAASSPTSHVPTAMTLQVYHGPSEMYTVTWAPTGTRIASAGLGQTIQIWDPASAQVLFSLNGNSNIVYSAAWSPDGQHIASGHADGTVQVWDANSGNHLLTLTGHTQQVNSVAWSPDSTRIVSGSGDKTAKIWDLSSGTNLLTYIGHRHYVNSVAWSHDGAHIVSGSGTHNDDHTAQVWDATNGNPIFTYTGHSDDIVALAWSPDSTRVASTSNDGTVQIWNAFNGTLFVTYRGHSGYVISIGWSPNGQLIASGGVDATAQVWDATSGRHIVTYNKHTANVEGIAWASDSRRVASASRDATVQVWEVV